MNNLIVNLGPIVKAADLIERATAFFLSVVHSAFFSPPLCSHAFFITIELTISVVQFVLIRDIGSQGDTKST